MHYGDGPDGLPGNDDAGSTSAWYVLAALGLYPVAPGDGIWQISSPVHPRAVVHLHPGWSSGGTFVIEAPGAAEGHVYIQSAELDGKALDRPWLTHAELMAGGRCGSCWPGAFDLGSEVTAFDGGPRARTGGRGVAAGG